ncbi:MAG: hypothetical protein K0R14_233 [Burkholderiales bacterium]|jgi:DNA-binding XRE family transcriptional regulator|nr:hypothetical protein [Burkholderiales bacterium]
MSKDCQFTNNLSINLKYLMKTTGITSVDLAKSVGVSAETIGKIKNGLFLNPSLKVLMGICNHFKITLNELISKNLANRSQPASNEFSEIPVIGWDKIKDWKDAKPESSIHIEDMVSKSIFALHIGNSYGGVFPKNSFIFVDTALKTKNNVYVLVQCNNNESFNIKKFIIEDHLYLQSVLPDVNSLVKYDPKEYLIFGVIIGYHKTKFFKY